MSEELKQDDRRKLVREALRTIDDLHGRLRTAENALRAPIAIVGMGCRYPGGVTDPNSFWQLLCSGTDAVTEVPADRRNLPGWRDIESATVGKSSACCGGFLEGIDSFDAPFFGISPREAAVLDPQHRILLEVSWEALENAGQPMADLAGSQTGVFVGITTSEYYQLVLRTQAPEARSLYIGTGNTLNAAAGRLSFFLGTHGPSVAVDTACSSSLTAIHLACQSLRAGDCQMALAGGVNVIVLPETSALFSKWGMMAADGRCKTFDAAADGFVRSEGCGIVVLKRLSDALAAGDQILAVIEGSAVNQDGRSSGLTVPNGIAQEALIRQALANAGVAPGQIDYVEAHGTGTSLGDPIEVDALSAVFSPGRDREHKLKIGSVKTNLGHTEAASGVAGLIKCVLALQHDQLPPQLHLRRPTPQVNWETMPIEVVVEPVAWRRGDSPRRAGVSSFGFSGANAHVVLAEAPLAVAEVDALNRPQHILALSARSAGALEELARRYACALRQQVGAPLSDFCFTANTGRARFRHRVAAFGGSREEIAASLSRYSKSDGSALPRGEWSGEPVKIAFLFTGQGSQYAGMGRQLYGSQPTFRAELNRCASLLASHLDRPLLDLLFTPADRGAKLDQTGYTQPALFALEWSLAQLWRSWGIEPTAMLGHSVGEYVAACQCGIMSLEEGLQLICDRARLMQSLPADGMMAALATDEAFAQELVAPFAATAAIAAVNGPRNVVVSGRSDSIRKIIDQAQAYQISAIHLAVSHAFHSPLVEPILDRLEQVAQQVKYGRPQTPMVTNLTGNFAQDGEVGSAGYWRRHAREPVRFADGLQQLHQKGCRLFLEIGPTPTLTNMARQVLTQGDQSWLPSLVKGRDEWTQMLHSLAQLYVHGAQANWTGFDSGYSRRRVALPTYPFERKRFWVDQPSSSDAFPDSVRPIKTKPADAAGGAMLQRMPGSPLVKEIIYCGQIGTAQQPWLADHVVAGQVVVPMTAYIDMALSAAVDNLKTNAVTIEDLVLHERLVVNAEQAADLQLVLVPDEPNDSLSFRIISLGHRESDHFILHASGRLRRRIGVSPGDEGDGPNGVATHVGDCAQSADAQISGDDLYKQFTAHGVNFGESFRGVQRVTVAAGKAVGEILSDGSAAFAEKHGVFYPPLLDACLQPLACVWPAQADRTFLPFAVERIDVWGSPTPAMTSYCFAREKIPDEVRAPGGTFVGDATLCDASGRPIASVRGLTARPLEAVGVPDPIDDWLYEVEWRIAADVVPGRSAESLMPSTWVAAELARQNRPEYLAETADQGFAQALRLLLARSLNYVLQAMESLGWKPKPGDTVNLSKLARQFDVQPRYERLLARLLSLLVDAGCCESVTGGWRVKRPLAITLQSMDLATVERETSATARTAFAAELAFLDRCGTRLAEVLRGECDPLQLLFGDGSAERLEAIYSESPAITAINQLAADVFSGIVQAVPEQCRFRVLEIGGGTGGTTSHVLKKLPADRTEYCFTDISPTLLARARARFGDFPFMQFELLDIERESDTQGFAGRLFDVILAANVLHATADLRSALARVRRLLVPGGLLVLAEGTRSQSWIDLTFGLTDGWWKFNDHDLRPDGPLLPAPKWLKLLVDEGFSSPIDLGGPSADGHAPDYCLFIARGGDAAWTVSAARDTWLLFADEGGVANRVADELKRRKQRCVTVRPAAVYAQISPDEFGLRPAERDDYDRLLKDIHAAGQRCCGIAHLWSLDATVPDTASTAQLMGAQDRSSRSLLFLAQALLVSGQPMADGLWIVTRGAQPVGHDAHRIACAQAPVWGLGKVLALEHPELRVGRLDLDPAAIINADEAKLISDVLLGSPESRQCAFRGESLYVRQLVRKRTGAMEPIHLVAAQTGRLDSLKWQPSIRRPPGPAEVEIRVHTVGLNFRDVLSALDMYPGDAGPLGGEVAGVVVAVGSDVTDVAVGDAVAALATGGFSNFVTTAADLTLEKPAEWSFAEIVTVPAAFATAYHALIQLAGIQRGERVLIHAAAGGVGLAAIQIARQVGCQIIATAGSPQKREYLRSIGVDHVFDSRSLAFADAVRAALSDGGGIDVILNSLSGEFIRASLSLLSTSGRFVELGKREIWDAARVALIRPQASYFIVDLAAQSQHSPADYRPIFAAAGAAIAAGTFRPLPLRIFPRDAVCDAFRFMSQARHIGKVVVGMGGVGDSGSDANEAAMRTNTPATPPFHAHDEGTYLITGGLSGLGLRTAQWLAARGAKHVALTGRGEPTDAARQVLAKLTDSGVNVLLCPGDVARPSDVDRALEAIAASHPPLRGVIHSAGVLDDGAIVQQEWSRFERVLLPKMAGAWNLHVATRGMPLDFFVCYSSASAILGSSGQANHAAANAFLDALAHHRRGLGLPALSINWGAWSDIGAAANLRLLNRVANLGVGAITPDQGIAALERLIVDGCVQAAVVPIDWTRFRTSSLPPEEQSFFAKLYTKPASAKTPDTPRPASFQMQLKSATPADRRKLIQTEIRDALISIAGLDRELQLDPLQSFRDLGFDSLMSIELRNRMQSSLGRPLPATLAFDYPSLSTLVDYLTQEPTGPTAQTHSPTGQQNSGREEKDIEQFKELSAAQTEELLSEELAMTRELLL